MNWMTSDHRNLIALAFRHHECLPASGGKTSLNIAKWTTFRTEKTKSLTRARRVFYDCLSWIRCDLWYTLTPWKYGWRGNFLAYHNQHVYKPTWVKLQRNGHSRSALKCVLNMAILAPSEERLKKVEPNRPFIWPIISRTWWLVDGQALKSCPIPPGFPGSVLKFGTPHHNWHISEVVHKAGMGLEWKHLLQLLQRECNENHVWSILPEFQHLTVLFCYIACSVWTFIRFWF